jgi:hypothetical protein
VRSHGYTFYSLHPNRSIVGIEVPGTGACSGDRDLHFSGVARWAVFGSWCSVDSDSRSDCRSFDSSRLPRRRRREFFRHRNRLAESNHVSSIEIGSVSCSIKEGNVFGH